MPIYTDPNRRHDFVLLFDCQDGNPNGDPDAGNLPRTDPETMQGIVTDVAIKRKVRNYVATVAADLKTKEQAHYAQLKIFVEHRGVLNAQIRRAYTELGFPTGKPVSQNITDLKILAALRELETPLPEAFTLSEGDEADVVSATLSYSGELSDIELKAALEQVGDNKQVKKIISELAKAAGKPDKNRDHADKARWWMCQNFYDIRLFGAVMGTGLNAGHVRGPIQLTFARSVDPVLPQDLAITRVAVTREEEREKLQTIGRKTYIPYGLYIGYGFYSPHLAAQTGVTQADLELFWAALINMWSLDRSAARGMMAPRGLYVFSHESNLGNSPAHKLFEHVQVHLNKEVASPRKFTDYQVSVDSENLPTGITLNRLIEG